MDKVEKAEGVNRKFWSAYKSESAHAGDLLKVSEAQTANFCFLITLVVAGLAFPGRHAELEHLIYQSSHRITSFFFFFARLHVRTIRQHRGVKTQTPASGLNKWRQKIETSMQQ